MESLSSVITPESAACGQAVKLGAIDQIAPRVYITSFLFFKLPEDADIRQIHADIQRALYYTLQDIPQLMTVIRPCNNGREDLELAYDRERGCLIKFKDYVSTEEARAQWPHGTFDEMEAAYFPYSACEKSLTLAPVEEYADGCSPSLAVQTNFIQGGLVLSSQLSHTVCDGTGNYLYYQTFAKHCAAISRGEKIDPGAPMISFFERTQVVDPDHNVHIDQFPNWKPVQSGGSFLNPIHYDPTKYPKVQYAVFFIDDARLKKLRTRLTSETNKPSSIEALGAFLWQQVVQARDIDADKYPEAKLSITVDTRKRMTMPVVPSNFWGNLSEPNAVARMPTRSLMHPMINDPSASSPAARAAQSVAELQTKLAEAAKSASDKWNAAVINAQDKLQEAARTAQDKLQEAARNAQDKLNEAAQAAADKFPEAAKTAQAVNQAWNTNLSEASKRIRQALVAVDNTAVRRLVGLLNQMPKSTSLTWNVDRWPGPDMLIVCVNYHYYFHLDFGLAMGKPHGGRFSIGDTEGRPDGRCLLMPPRWQDGKGIEVALQYDLDTLERLQASKDFMEFFERRN